MQTNSFIQTWKLNNLDFYLVVGDIFAVPVEAIVNSEQTNFILAPNTHTISGKINFRFGQQVQSELNSQTKGKTLPEGTVLKTGPVGDYKAIYHAGFHLPWAYPDFEHDASQVEYLRIIRSCIRQVLDDFKQSTLESVAFPLIGTGVFSIDPKLLAYEFMLELFAWAESTIMVNRKSIWLVIYSGDENKLLLPVLNSIVQALIDRSNTAAAFEPMQLSVTYLDEFETQVVRSNHPQWTAWLLARYAELVTSFLFYNLALANHPPVYPPKVMKQDVPASFGTLRDKAVSMVKSHILPESFDRWTKFYINLIEHDLLQGDRLQRLNTDRNNIAHGRDFRPTAEIRNDLIAFLRPDDWHTLSTQEGPPDIKHLYPWLAEQSTPENQNPQVGILDKWSQKKWIYLIPASGKTFTIELPQKFYES